MRHGLAILLSYAGVLACTPASEAPTDAGLSLDASPGAPQAEAAALLDADNAAPTEASTPPVGDGAPGVPEDAGSRADSGAAPGDDGYLGLAAPQRGFRLRTLGREIPADSDLEFCEVSELPGNPGDEILMGAVQVANGSGSHHLIVSAAAPGSPADKKLRTLKVGDQVACIGASIEFGEGLTSFAGSQSLSAMAEYPPGVAMRLRAGQRVVFDYHYFNFGTKPITAKSAVAVQTLDRAAVKTIASTFAFTNFTLDTPPSSTRTFTASCRFKQDALVQGVGRHTHTRGTDFTVWFEGGARHAEKIWQSLDWEHDTVHAFPQPTLVKAGEGFKFACSFRNDGTKPLRFGIASTDEMCILNGAIWSPTPGLELKEESCVITWVDAQGVGHDAKDEGGPPPAPLQDALTCHASTLGIGFLESCVGCMCDSCGTIMTRCNADPDCKALLDCRTNCNAATGNCAEVCEPQMFQHSSAVGMITQVGTCIEAKCGAKCVPAGAADAGVP